MAIDCEFVAVELEETRQREDGTAEVIKPARHTLGRVRFHLPLAPAFLLHHCDEASV